MSDGTRKPFVIPQVESDVSRRGFVFAAAAGVIGVTRFNPLAGLFRHAPSAADVVTIVDFDAAGTRKATMRVPMVVKTDDEWKKLLSPMEYAIARERGTERAFTGAYWNLHDQGLFRCVCCDTALFSSKVKFDSGTGWPSFWEPIAEENVVHGKPSNGYYNSETKCRRCDAHLGDLFDDGPKPTGLRYCTDSASLKFVKFS
jgi:peptide-methionine (R)-S-oxide reductase